MKKRHILTFIITIIFILTGCSQTLSSDDGKASSSNMDRKEDNSFVIGVLVSPASQNPFNGGTVSANWSMRFIYETMLDQVGPTEFQPRLAKFETEDNQNFTITVHPDAKWTDGEPVRAQDIYYTINTIAHPDTLTDKASSISMIEGTDGSGKIQEKEEKVSGISIIDDKSMSLTTKSPVDINYISEILGTKIFIAPEHVFGEIPNDEIQTSEAALNPTVTNGAFEFVEYAEDNHLHVTANEEYYRGSPKLDDIFIKVVHGSNMVTELLSGNIQANSSGGIGEIPHLDIHMIEEVDHLDVDSNPSPVVQYLSINTKHPRFQDKRVRQALAYAINRDMAVEQLMLGNGETPSGPYSSVSEYNDPAIDPYPYDPEKAKFLLEEAGFDFDEPVELLVPIGNAIREQYSELVAQDLEAIGMTVTQSVYDLATYNNYMREGNFQIAMDGYGHTYDPDITNIVGSGGGQNEMNYSSSKMDQLLEEGIQATDSEERYTIYQEVQEVFKEDAPLIPLYSEHGYVAQDKRMNGGIQGFHPASFANVHEWEWIE